MISFQRASPNPDHIPFSNSKTCQGPDEDMRLIPRMRQRSKNLMADRFSSAPTHPYQERILLKHTSRRIEWNRHLKGDAFPSPVRYQLQGSASKYTGWLNVS
jgi:hypothetical protein